VAAEVEALVPYELGVVVTLVTLAVEVVSVVSVEVVMLLTLELESDCGRWEREQDRSE
jgi:hypothetical protein